MVTRKGNNRNQRRYQMHHGNSNSSRNLNICGNRNNLQQTYTNSNQNRRQNRNFIGHNINLTRNNNGRNNTPNLYNLNTAASISLQIASQMVNGPGYLDFNESRENFSPQNDNNRNFNNINRYNLGNNMNNRNRGNFNNNNRRNNYRWNDNLIDQICNNQRFNRNKSNNNRSQSGSRIASFGGNLSQRISFPNQLPFDNNFDVNNINQGESQKI